jgi:hypothetical protein
MPVRLNNPDLYSAGNVVIRNEPYMRYALEVQARNRARDDAFARSFQELGARVTPAGMDGLDIDNFMKRKKEWQDYVVRNEEAYKNPAIDNGQVYGEAMRRYNNVLGVIQGSKDKLERIKPLRQIFQDPKKRALISQRTMNAYERSTLPINHPNYEPFDMSNLDYDEAPFDEKQLKTFAGGVKNIIAPSLKNKVYGKTTIDAAKNQKITDFEIKLSDSDYDNIRGYANVMLSANPQLENFLKNEINNPNDLAVLNAVYKNHFGQDANIENLGDAATALALSNVSSDLKGQEKSAYTNSLGNQMTMFGLRDAAWYEHQKYKEDHPTSSSSGGVSAASIDDYILQLQTNAEKRMYKKANGEVEDRWEVQPNPDLSVILSKKIGDKTYYPDQVQIKANGDVVPLYYKLNKDGTVAKGENGNVAIDKEMSIPVSKEEFRVRVAKKLLGVKGAQEALRGAKPQTTKPAEPTKKTIKKSDIATKAANAGASVKEYTDFLIKHGIKIID